MFDPQTAMTAVEWSRKSSFAPPTKDTTPIRPRRFNYSMRDIGGSNPRPHLTPAALKRSSGGLELPEALRPPRRSVFCSDRVPTVEGSPAVGTPPRQNAREDSLDPSGARRGHDMRLDLLL